MTEYGDMPNETITNPNGQVEGGSPAAQGAGRSPATGPAPQGAGRSPATLPTCYCGEKHPTRPRIAPTSEITRLVEVWVCPEMRSHLSQWLQGDTRPAIGRLQWISNHRR